MSTTGASARSAPSHRARAEDGPTLSNAVREPPSAPAASRGEVLFRARGLTKTYQMGEVEVHALRSVDLDVYAGEFVVILGPSGSGKSTLLNILGGLDAPTSGDVTFRDHDLTAAGDAELTRYRREHVGFVFQFYNIIPSLTALENVALDTETGRLVLEVLRKVNAELGTAVVVITHNAAIAGMADRVPRMQSGRIASVEHNEGKVTPSEISW